MVELKDFVRDSIVQIVAGIREADKIVSEHGGAVNPTQRSLPLGTVQYNYKVGEKGYFTACQDVEFDVAVVAIDQGSTGAKVGVLVGMFGGALEAENKDSEERASRLRFKIPVGLPPAGSEGPTVHK